MSDTIDLDKLEIDMFCRSETWLERHGFFWHPGYQMWGPAPEVVQMLEEMTPEEHDALRVYLRLLLERLETDDG